MEATAVIDQMSSFVAGTEQETRTILQACYECGKTQPRSHTVFCAQCAAYYCVECDCPHVAEAMGRKSGIDRAKETRRRKAAVRTT